MEKTEKPSAKKRKKARSEGQVAKSTEVTTAFCSIVMFAFVIFYWPTLTNNIANLFGGFWGPGLADMSKQLDVTIVQALVRQVIYSLVGIVFPIMVIALVTGIIINVVQVGFIFTTKPLAPKLSKLSPLKGLKRLLSPQSVINLAKSLFKIVILGYLVYSEYTALMVKFPQYMGLNIYLSYLDIMRTVFTIALKMCVVLGIIAAFDYLYQWWKFEKDLKMTKQEVKDEYKQSEGDPQVKSRIRQKQRQMSAMRMMEKVPSADVVITNPTHYAVALKYEENKSGAPVVVAKGQDYVARKIKETAREHNIEIVENKPLAQALFAMCEVGDEIPEEFYRAVADILVYVYKRKNPRTYSNRRAQSSM